jgi:hypothetical protein
VRPVRVPAALTRRYAVAIVYLILLILGALFFLFAAVGSPQTKFNLVAAGLLAWILVPLIKQALGLPG